MYTYIETVNTLDLCTTIIPFDINRKGFSNLTGFFPHKSSRVNLYVMVMYDYDSDAILPEPIKFRKASTIWGTFINMHKILKSRVTGYGIVYGTRVLYD